MVPLQQEPEFRQMERLLDIKGRRSQNWERTPQDRLGKTGLEECKALQADCDDTELAIRFQTLNQLVKVSHNELMPNDTTFLAVKIMADAATNAISKQ